MKTFLKLSIMRDLCKTVYYMDVLFSSQTLRHDLDKAYKENLQLMTMNQKEEAELKILTEAVHR